MTTDQLTELTELEEARKRECENDIKVSFWVMVDRMATMERERLYRAGYSTFSNWLLERYPELTHNGKGISESTWRQWKASWKAYDLAKTNGVELSNEHAARSLRMVEDSLRVLVINQTVARQELLTGVKPEQLTAAMIKPVVEEIKKVIDVAATTDGHVDTGNGTMTAFSASVKQEEHERILRQRQHIRDGVKGRGGWSDTLQIRAYQLKAGELFWKIEAENNFYPTDNIEIRWRVVVNDNDSLNPFKTVAEIEDAKTEILAEPEKCQSCGDLKLEGHTLFPGNYCPVCQHPFYENPDEGIEHE